VVGAEALDQTSIRHKADSLDYVVDPRLNREAHPVPPYDVIRALVTA